MAEIYLEAIRGVRPRGPYLLGGYSGGGVVALEMARRLVAAGEHVSTVVLLDTFHPSTEARRTQPEGPPVRTGRTTAFAYLPQRARARALRQLTALPQELRLRYYLSRGRPLPHDLRDAHLTRHFLEVSRRHVPLPYAGPVTLFRARRSPAIYAHMGPRLGWDPAHPAPARGCGSAGEPRYCRPRTQRRRPRLPPRGSASPCFVRELEPRAGGESIGGPALGSSSAKGRFSPAAATSSWGSAIASPRSSPASRRSSAGPRRRESRPTLPTRASPPCCGASTSTTSRASRTSR